jgi:hypothetical protein
MNRHHDRHGLIPIHLLSFAREFLIEHRGLYNSRSTGKATRRKYLVPHCSTTKNLHSQVGTDIRGRPGIVVAILIWGGHEGTAPI